LDVAGPAPEDVAEPITSKLATRAAAVATAQRAEMETLRFIEFPFLLLQECATMTDGKTLNLDQVGHSPIAGPQNAQTYHTISAEPGFARAARASTNLCGARLDRLLSFGVTVLPDPPWQRLVELMQLAEANGFEYGWTYDSHVLWQEPYPLLTLCAMNTKSLKLGLNVTNPGTREPTVTASAFATLQDISGGRMVMGIGRGDSARRVIGQKPTTVAQLEAAVTMMRRLMRGEPVQWNETEIELKWAAGLEPTPVYVAGYGPRVLAVAGRVADGIIIQLADPEIVEWIVGQVRAAAEEAGRDPHEIKVMACAPAFVSDDVAAACEQVRWFPAMVSNHVFDVLSKHDPATLPAALTDYVGRMQREHYDYTEHSRVGATHGEQVTDETCERFCILGTPEQHVEKLRRLEAAGVDQWNIYLMTSGQEQTLEAYGREIIPALRTS
jgi:probable F420-dependent oxidoreductase